MKVLLKKKVCESCEQCTGPVGTQLTRFSKKKKKKEEEEEEEENANARSKHNIQTYTKFYKTKLVSLKI